MIRRRRDEIQQLTICEVNIRNVRETKPAENQTCNICHYISHIIKCKRIRYDFIYSYRPISFNVILFQDFE